MRWNMSAGARQVNEERSKPVVQTIAFCKRVGGVLSAFDAAHGVAISEAKL